MNRRTFLVDAAGTVSAMLAMSYGLQGSASAQKPRPRAASTPATGPLRVLSANPRYFTDGSGKAIYLTGSHTWPSLVDGVLVTHKSNPTPRFDFNAYLDFLKHYNHNFIRLWTIHSAWDAEGTTGARRFPLPYRRTGPGNALDGKPKFNLTQYEPAYFNRLRQRVIAARDRGIYVSIMLFEQWYGASVWQGDPYHASNNVNGINGDKNGDAYAEVETLADPAITRLQEAYVRHVIDTVNDLDNVLYEIANEVHDGSIPWVYHMINVVRQYEASKPKQHPIGMTSPQYGGAAGNAAMFSSAADWISPGDAAGADYSNDPPAADGRKVILLDTDHLSNNLTAGHAWVWKTFLRGMQPIYMDPLPTLTGVTTFGNPPASEDVRRAMGQTRTYANKVQLAAMAPWNSLASTGYCLANPGQEYLVYLPDGGEVTVDLTAAKGPLVVEPIHPTASTFTPGGTVDGGSKRTLKAPFDGDAVLYIRRK